MADALERLDLKIEQLAAKRAGIIARAKETERKRDTRRKVLLGAGLIALVRARDAPAVEMYGRIRQGLAERQAAPFEGWAPVPAGAVHEAGEETS